MFFFGLFRKKSGSIAKERLANVLVSDRARCAPDTLRSIQNDISHTLSKYMEINTKAIDFKVVSPEKPVPVLVVYIPFKEIPKTAAKERHD